jgi:phosphorylase kinase alpha/beta subunit
VAGGRDPSVPNQHQIQELKMATDDDSRLGFDELQPKIQSQLQILETLVLPNGAVLASPNAHYRAHWVRDGLYVLMAAQYLGLSDLAHRLIRAPFSIFHKHRARLLRGIRAKAEGKDEFLNARYHPAHFDEIEGEWGHNQLDMIGLFLYLVATLPTKGIDVFHWGRQHEDKILLNHITRYLETLEWWHCEDFGVWEEGPELHASSIGAVLAGLERIRDLDDEDLVFNEAQLARGREALAGLLPAESSARHCDFAQLSLIWPFDVLDDDQIQRLLANIEDQLVRDHGVIRYRCDAYFNAADDRLILSRERRSGLELVDYGPRDRDHFTCAVEGSEAQWPLGLAWLSIVHSKLAKRYIQHGHAHLDHAHKARHYLERVMACALPVPGMALGWVPELYVGGRPNVNTPLTWVTAFIIVAAVAYLEIEDRDVPYSVL